MESYECPSCVQQGAASSCTSRALGNGTGATGLTNSGLHLYPHIHGPAASMNIILLISLLIYKVPIFNLNLAVNTSIVKKKNLILNFKI